MHTVRSALARALPFCYRRSSRKVQWIQAVCRCFLVNPQPLFRAGRGRRHYSKSRKFVWRLP